MASWRFRGRCPYGKTSLPVMLSRQSQPGWRVVKRSRLTNRTATGWSNLGCRRSSSRALPVWSEGRCPQAAVGDLARYPYTQSVHTVNVVSRTVSLSEDAYQALQAAKRPGESFSDVVRRLTRRRSLTELADAVDPEAAEAIARAVEAEGAERRARRQDEMGLP